MQNSICWKTLPRVLSSKHAQGQENKLLIFHLHLGLWISEGQKKRLLLLFKTKEPLFLQKKNEADLFGKLED